jgi:hypothetical protein
MVQAKQHTSYWVKEDKTKEKKKVEFLYVMNSHTLSRPFI